MTPEERAIQWRRLAARYDRLAADARRRAVACAPFNERRALYRIDSGRTHADLYGPGGRVLRLDLPLGVARSYERRLNSGALAEIDLP